MTKRKDIRLTLKPDVAEMFEAAKERAERDLGYILKDSDFAGRVISQGVRVETVELEPPRPEQGGAHDNNRRPFVYKVLETYKNEIGDTIAKVKL